MSDLTVFIITTGEESLSACAEAIKRQRTGGRYGFGIEIIRDVYPLSEAFNQMHRRCRTAYFIQVDADVILNDGAIDTLYEAARKSNLFVYAAYGQLYEEGFGPGGSVRCWKRGIFNIFKFRDVRTTDRDLYRRAMLLGFHRRNVKKVLGVHRPRQSSFSDYCKTKSDIEKWQFLKRPFERYAEGLYRNLILDPGKNRYKILGLLMGVMASQERIHKSKDTLHEEKRIKSVFNFLGSDFRTFILREDIDLLSLLETARRAYGNYSPAKRASLNEVFKEAFDADFGKDEFERLYHIVRS